MMSDRKRTRRELFGTSAGVTAAVASLLADPPHAAAQSAGVKRGRSSRPRPYQDKFRIDKDGYVLAPTEPGLGYPIHPDALDKIMKRIDR
jgi:L-alanine-DL-glutamate epimerase-like enolase superfamily enzyme